MSSEIDTLMDLDPLELSAKNIDEIIAYHRQRRAEREAGGGRAKKDTGPKLSLGNLVKEMTKDVPKQEVIIKRRI